MANSPPPPGSPTRTTACDGPCKAPDAHEVVVSIPRVHQRFILEPQRTSKQEYFTRVVPRTVIQPVEYDETVMVPEVQHTSGTREVVVRELRTVPKTHRRVTLEPKKVKKTVTTSRPVSKTVDDVEIRATVVPVQKEEKYTEMVSKMEKETVYIKRREKQVRCAHEDREMPRLCVATRSCKPRAPDATGRDAQKCNCAASHGGHDAVFQRFVEYAKGFPEADLMEIAIVNEVRPCVCIGQEELEVDVMEPRVDERMIEVPEERSHMITVHEVQEEEVKVKRQVVEMLEETHEIEVTEMVEHVEEYTTQEEEIVERTEIVPEESTQILSVPKSVRATRLCEQTIIEEVQEARQVERMEMVEKVVQDHYEEKRVFRFDPVTGAQLDDLDGTSPTPIANRSLGGSPLPPVGGGGYRTVSNREQAMPPDYTGPARSPRSASSGVRMSDAEVKAMMRAEIERARQHLQRVDVASASSQQQLKNQSGASPTTA